MPEPEQQARNNIDEMLRQAGWEVQDRDQINLGASLGVAVREYPTEHGQADYALFVDKKAAGIIEAKPEGATLSGVSDQSREYAESFPEDVPHIELPLRFRYESTGVETQFTDNADPDPRQRRIFHIHQPETLQEWGRQSKTLRARLKEMPDLPQGRLYDCQFEAIKNLEQSLANNRPRSLIQMATGSGKTFMAVTECYRLLKHAKAHRILFLVDRNNLGKQAANEFAQYTPEDDNRNFPELFNVQHLTTSAFDPVNKVVISTIQRLYSMLKGEELEPEADDTSPFEQEEQDSPVEVEYNPDLPPETFDFIIVDECHRSIYNKWRQVLDYFDAFVIGLTATPAKQTFGFFNQNLVMEYPHERAVADNVNVGYDVYRIKTEITEEGSTIERGDTIKKRDKRTRQEMWETLDEDMGYSPTELDRNVVAQDQIRTIMKSFRQSLDDMFPDRDEVPKTLVFAKNDAHAEDIVHITRRVFDKGNQFCKKITYRSEGDPEELIQRFRTDYHPRIAVSVDMISTGTDVKPIECLLFMRDVNSRTYFEQMKGRGTRTISENDLRAVTPDARTKTHFVIVDAVGVCQSEKTDSRSLEREPSISFEQLVQDIAQGKRDEDRVTTLASRLSRFDKSMNPDQKQQLETATDQPDLQAITNDLLDAVEPEQQQKRAQERFDTDDPTDEQLEQARQQLVNDACEPFDDPDYRDTLMDVKQQNTQYVDTVSSDSVISAEYDAEAKEESKGVVDTFREFLAENRDEITALQIVYNRPYGEEKLTFDQIKELADAIQRPPYQITPQRLWKAYERLEESVEQGARTDVQLTDIISILRYELNEIDELKPFAETVDERFESWLQDQKSDGNTFTDAQLEWLNMIKEEIAKNVYVQPEDFQMPPFHDRGGLVRARELFGDDLNDLLEELHRALAA